MSCHKLPQENWIDKENDEETTCERLKQPVVRWQELLPRFNSHPGLPCKHVKHEVQPSWDREGILYETSSPIPLTSLQEYEL